MAPADLPVAALLLAALYTDLTRQKVPNVLTLGGMALGLVANAIAGDPLVGVVGVGVAFLLMFPGWRLGRTLRAGDAKLLMAVGAFYGGGEILRAGILTYVLAFPYALAILLAKGRLGNVLPAIRAGIGEALGQKVAPAELTVVPFVPVVCAAVLVARATEVLAWLPP